MATTGQDRKTFTAHYGRDKRDIRCECGGQISAMGTLHPMTDMGIGYKNGKFVVDRKYSRKVIGYEGFCLKCRKSGRFLLEGAK